MGEDCGIRASELKRENIPSGLRVACGDDFFWRGYAEKIYRSLLPEGSLSLFVIDEVRDAGEILSAVSTSSFSGDGNVVIVRDRVYPFTDAEWKKLAEAPRSFGAYLLIFRDKISPSLVKRIGIVDCGKEDRGSCARFASNFFGRGGIDGSALYKLVDYCDCDMSKIFLEAEKLAAYSEGNRVTSADVEETVSEDVDYTIFNVVDSIGRGRKERAVKQLGRLESQGVAPSHILGTLIKHFSRSLHASISPLPDGELAKLLGVKEYFVKLNRERRNLSRPDLKKILEMLTDCEYNFKSGKLTEQTAFDSAMAKLLSGVYV